MALSQQTQIRPEVPQFSQSISQTPNMITSDVGLFDEFTPFEGGASSHNIFSTAYSSPSIQAAHDPNANKSSSSSTNMSTVSPQDLLRDPFTTAPNSSSLSNLTSPSTYNESPESNEKFDISPFVGNNCEIDQTLFSDPWFPLFPQEDNNQTQAENSPLLREEQLDVADALRSKGRRRSGAGPSSTGTYSAVTGVNSRKRDKPLPPIVVGDPNDTVAMKRARNTLAARKSRQRKTQRFEELEDAIAKLKCERDKWKQMALRRCGAHCSKLDTSP